MGERIDTWLVCGGRFHDFDFARLELLRLLGADDRVRTHVSADYADVDRLAETQALVTYTCDVRPTPPQQEALARFVAGGGRWLALHGTNAALDFTPAGVAAPRVFPDLARLLGSQFVAHPPIAPYTVTVSAPDHPLVRGIGELVVDDELYLCEYHDREELVGLLETRYTGPAAGFVEGDWPDDEPRLVMYLRPWGEGEVCYLTLGHCRGHLDMRPLTDYYPVVERGAWEVPAFHELLRRALRWVTHDAEVA